MSNPDQARDKRIGSLFLSHLRLVVKDGTQVFSLRVLPWVLRPTAGASLALECSNLMKDFGEVPSAGRTTQKIIPALAIVVLPVAEGDSPPKSELPFAPLRKREKGKNNDRHSLRSSFLSLHLFLTNGAKVGRQTLGERPGRSPATVCPRTISVSSFSSSSVGFKPWVSLVVFLSLLSSTITHACLLFANATFL